MNKINYTSVILLFASTTLIAQEKIFVEFKIDPVNIQLVENNPSGSQYMIKIQFNGLDSARIQKLDSPKPKYYFYARQNSTDYRFIISSPSFKDYYINKSSDDLNKNSLNLGSIKLVSEFKSTKNEPFFNLCLKLIYQKAEVISIIKNYLAFGTMPKPSYFNSIIEEIRKNHNNLLDLAIEIQLNGSYDWDEMTAISQSITAKKSYSVVFNIDNKQQLELLLNGFENEIMKFNSIIEKLKKD